MPENESELQEKIPFEVKECALISIATGTKSQNLKEFYEAMKQIPESSIYHHFWGRLLKPQFDEPEYNNDFASWVSRGLHDKPLAERISMVIPTDFDNLEDLRQELLEVIEQRLDEYEYVPWARADQQFYFVQSTIIVLDTDMRFDHPAKIFPHLMNMSTGSIFYHFIDARKRTPERQDDFTTWLYGFGDEFQDLAGQLSGIDPYFSSLKKLRIIVREIFQQYFDGEIQ